MYAIVDIETTGGYASAHGITEVAIFLHDGEKITGKFETLVKPSVSIPYFIQSLTGITPAMVAGAPRFEEVAPAIFRMLQDRVFVAHNVNFDYSFLRHHLAASGFDLKSPKLCTVRLAKKVFPALPSYSLGNLCRHFSIPVEGRHRAGGDALATVRLFDLFLAANGAEHIRQFLKRNSREQSLPPNLPKEQVDNLPYSPGVYYFHDQKGKVIYVGKAGNIKYRVSSHFTHNGAGRQRQEFLRNIHSVTYQACGNELMAFILENVEIRKHWPKYNTSQKAFSASYGLYRYEDRSGYCRLLIEKKKPHLKAIYTFSLLVEGHRLLRQLISEFYLCPQRCFIRQDDGCDCTACATAEPAGTYNERVMAAVARLEEQLPTFAVMDDSYSGSDRVCMLVEKGRFYGMGYLPHGAEVFSAEELKPYLQAYPENDYIRGLIYQFAGKRPEKKWEFGQSILRESN